MGETRAGARSLGDPERRPWRDARSPAPLRDHQPALSQGSVGRVDRRGARPQRGGEGADGGQWIAGVEHALADCGLGSGRDLASGRARDPGGGPRRTIGASGAASEFAFAPSAGFAFAPPIIMILFYLKHEFVL